MKYLITYIVLAIIGFLWTVIPEDQKINDWRARIPFGIIVGIFHPILIVMAIPHYLFVEYEVHKRIYNLFAKTKLKTWR